MKKWNVYLRGFLVTEVYYTKGCDADYVRTSLIEHDHYSQNIEVREGQ